MTREQAYELIQQGKRVTHPRLKDKRYVQLTEGKILTEDSQLFVEEFWMNPNLAEGWEEYTKIRLRD